MPPLLGGMISFLSKRSQSGAAVSDDEGSEISLKSEEAAESAGSGKVRAETTTKKRPGRKAVAPVEKVEDDNIAGGDSEDAEDEELGDDEDQVDESDEYVVEAIRSHLVTDDGQIMFQIKWEGYEKRSDMTWEPEENLLSAEEILNSYLEHIGGRETILSVAAAEEKPKKKKRSRAATLTATPDTNDSKPNGKKARKDAHHPASATPPASITKAAFKPPTGSWEDEVQSINACEGVNGSVMVFLQWRTGEKTKHALDQVYKRCPQKMLKFYERHLVFKMEPNSDMDEEGTDE